MRHIPDYAIYFTGFISTLFFVFLGTPFFYSKFARSLMTLVTLFLTMHNALIKLSQACGILFLG